MELHKIALRIIIAYVFLLVILRLSGKETVGEGRPFDFVLGLIVGDLIDDVIWAEVAMSQFIVAVATLVLAQLSISFASFKSPALAKVFNGEDLMLMRSGAILKPATRRERLHRKEMAMHLRLAGLEEEDWPEVRSGWIDGHGRLAFLRQEWARPAQKEDASKLKKRRER